MELTEAQIKYMVNRFLSWRLPKDFNPDGGISAKRPNYALGVEWTLIGTNLFDATQATAMVRHIVEGMPTAARPEGDITVRLRQEAAESEALPNRIGDSDISTMREAANEIEALRAIDRDRY